MTISVPNSHLATLRYTITDLKRIAHRFHHSHHSYLFSIEMLKKNVKLFYEKVDAKFRRTRGQ